MYLVTAEEMRELDRATIERFGTPGHVLMERAGKGATQVLLERFPQLRRKGRRVVVVAGKGNNGGDGLVMARLLKKRGLRTEVVLLGRAADVKGDAERNLRAYRRLRGALHEVTSAAEVDALATRLRGADAVIDAIFGTGLNSEVRGVQGAAIECINDCGAPVFAVDIPSGLDADTGRPLGCAVRANATATFAFAKVGQMLHPGVELCGHLEVIDIGIAAEAITAQTPRTELLTQAMAAGLAPQRAADTHKGHCGHLLVVAGSFGKTGAAQLVSRGALRAGAGLVTLVGPASLYPIYAAGVLEAMTAALPDVDGQLRFAAERLQELVEGKSAVAIGPGIGTHGDARRTVQWLLQNAGAPLVIDADALTCIASDPSELRRARNPAILTPHPGEMARLLGSTAAEVQADRVETARRFAGEHGCTLVLKGARTVVAAPDGRAWINPTGNPGMASGGMGDALTGIVGGLLAQGLEPAEAARLGVYLHGLAADQAAAEGQIGLTASDVIAALRWSLHSLREDAGA
jgi:ADP-dependent NAD(P)H-hydrate dehydratase / NAD(P)H-hydrate epimerase